MRCIQLVLCIAFVSGIYGSTEYEAAMDEIEIANQGEHYDQVDMKLTEEQRATFKSMNSKSRNKRSLYDKLYNVRWPEAVVPVTFGSKFSEAEKATINEAMRTIENVSFTLKTYNVLIALHYCSCWSYIGRTNLGRQELSLGFGCVHADTAIHELLHALGFFHEQSRPDRDQYVTIKQENIRPGTLDTFTKYCIISLYHSVFQHLLLFLFKGYESNFDISEYSYKDGLGVKYDPESIMHYGR
ncbi:zinc metalloproteinase nas-13-like [Hydractinia symbiolongicarpus]|uniref:zinc metalloproteinase nas-13-like n=1 Tax=Hydractinia symbiolongicarpus TaxID=13093 RepID=UPI00254ECF50|nr:zinc metalloproteinase nas-13-like [Hydractinia symbiolongicarpus]